MSLSLSLGLSLRPQGSSSTAPTASSLDYTQADVLGGGSDITLTGTNLTGATSVTVGGTSATITGNTSTTVTFTPPAKSAGTYDVVVTTPSGSATLTSALEAWAPSTQAGCTLFCERPDYVVSGTGTWTARTGANPTQASSPPAASSGAPVFAANGYLDGAALNSLLTISAGTIFAVANPTNTNAVSETSLPYNNPTLVGNATNGTMGLAFGNLSAVPGFVFHMFDGTAYRGKHVPAEVGTYHAVVARVTSSALNINVDGGAFVSASLAPTGNWNSSAGATRLGGQYNGTSVLTSTMRAVVTYSSSISDAVATKLYKWAQQRHGVT